MPKINLNKKQVSRGKKEFEGVAKNADEKIKNAKNLSLSKKKSIRDGAKKTIQEQGERKKEIEELAAIFDRALKAADPAAVESRRREKLSRDRMDAARVKADIKLLQRKKKKYDIELDELELKLIIASLKRSINAVKKGAINPTGREYLDKLYKDLTGILGHA